MNPEKLHIGLVLLNNIYPLPVELCRIMRIDIIIIKIQSSVYQTSDRGMYKGHMAASHSGFLVRGRTKQ